MIRAVIFDFNGVLLDDESVHFDLFQEVLDQEGVHITEHDYHSRYLGLDDRACLETALQDGGQTASQARLDELIARKGKRYFEVAAQGLRFFPGAAECLARLSKTFPLAINSGALRAEIVFALDLLDRRDTIAVVVAAEDATYCKPHPEGYTLAHRGLLASGAAPSDLLPSECLVIEDSLAGIESAKGAGMKAVGVPNTYDRDALLRAGADAVVADLPSFTASWINAKFPAPSHAGALR
jgi:beta-phosphoglucomutase